MSDFRPRVLKVPILMCVSSYICAILYMLKYFASDILYGNTYILGKTLLFSEGVVARHSQHPGNHNTIQYLYFKHYI